VKALKDCLNVDQLFYLCKNMIFYYRRFFSFTYSSWSEVHIYLLQKYLP
jgi:hypothetical protein